MPKKSMPRKDLPNQDLANKIVNRILDHGLETSTWRDNNSAAYEELLWYRTDMAVSVRHILVKELGEQCLIGQSVSPRRSKKTT